MAKRYGTDGSLLASLPWTLAALSFAIAAHVPFLPIWITVAFFACAGVRYVIERRRMRLPSTWVRGLLALMCFVGVWLTYSTISGVGPGSALLAIMAALKLLETRKRRDQFVLLFIAVFLVMASLLRDQFLWSIPYLVVGVTLIMTAWLRMSASESMAAMASVRTTSRLMLYALPLAMAMWVFFPRLSVPFWSVPIDTSRGSSGLSDTMSPGDISSLSLSDAVAFRVRFAGDVPVPRDRYWRGLVLRNFNGRTWAAADPIVDPRPGERIEFLGEPIDYEVTLEPTNQRWIFALELPSSWSLRDSFMTRRNLVTSILPVDQRIAYKARSYPGFRSDLDLSELAKSWNMLLPESGNRRTRDLARSMRAAAGSDRDFIRAVLNMFNREEFYYTLEPPPLGSNPVDRFLFDTRQGFCEHYASAFSVMLRAAGIPTRVVVGYQGGELNPLGGHMVVRQSDAHAWAEAWLDGEGWVRFDPTAAVAPERVEIGISEALLSGIGQSWGFSSSSRLVYQFEMAVDLVNAKLDEWILGYGPENQNRLMEWLGMEDPSWRKMMLTLIGVVVVMILIISYLLFLRYQPPKVDEAAALYQRYVRKTGVVPRTGETAVEFAERAKRAGKVSESDVMRITSRYMATRYGPADESSLALLRQAVGAVT
ncbi:MAG: DUF3488 and transglutaminase-like domain-containing protein [Woeseiaceae bacterium]|nr:DUF3488 and transglutaminase-like domain-containing protein [Woeseiaceae bacterium]